MEQVKTIFANVKVIADPEPVAWTFQGDEPTERESRTYSGHKLEANVLVADGRDELNLIAFLQRPTGELMDAYPKGEVTRCEIQGKMKDKIEITPDPGALVEEGMFVFKLRTKTPLLFSKQVWDSNPPVKIDLEYRIPVTFLARRWKSANAHNPQAMFGNNRG